MINNKIEKLYLILISLIPISIVAGSAISLLNIFFILIFFLLFTFWKLDKNIFKNNILYSLIIIYVYLIFNSFIAIDFETSANRNFGFIRFILLFIAINYFFSISDKTNNIFNFWSIVIFIVAFDSYIEFIFGRNILGYGELYGERIVSFFKDEPIVGGFVNGFIFIVIGYYFDKLKKKDFKYQLILPLIILFLFVTVMITGERSNTIKLIFGLFLFFVLNKEYNIKKKIITFITILTFFFVILVNSDYLKSRYYGGFVYHLLDFNRLSIFLQKQQYFELYKSGYAVFKDYPIFGVGNKNYRVITIRDELVRKDYEVSTHPHQIYFEILSEHGIVGCIILLTLIFFLMFKNLKIIILSRNSVQLGCFVYLIINFLPLLPGGSFFGDLNSTLFWLNLSIMYACNPQTNIFVRDYTINKSG